MNNQEAFNKAYLGLMDQGAISGAPDGGFLQCQYLALDGNRCAIGMLFDVNSDILGELRDCDLNVRAMLNGYPEAKAALEGVDEGLLWAMQIAHDSVPDMLDVRPENLDSITPEMFRTQLTKDFGLLATKYGLTMPKWAGEAAPNNATNS